MSLFIVIEDLDEGVVDTVLEAEVAEADINVDGNHREAHDDEEEVDVSDVDDLVHTAFVEGTDCNAQDGAEELDRACGSNYGGQWGVWVWLFSGLGFWMGGEGNGGRGEERAQGGM